MHVNHKNCASSQALHHLSATLNQSHTTILGSFSIDHLEHLLAYLLNLGNQVLFLASGGLSVLGRSVALNVVRLVITAVPLPSQVQLFSESLLLLLLFGKFELDCIFEKLVLLDQSTVLLLESGDFLVHGHLVLGLDLKIGFRLL